MRGIVFTFVFKVSKFLRINKLWQKKKAYYLETKQEQPY